MECLPDFKFHLIFQVVMHWIWNHVLPKFWLKWLVSWEFCQDHYVEPKKLYCRIVSWSRYYRKSILVDGFTDLENMKLNGKNNPVYSGKNVPNHQPEYVENCYRNSKIFVFLGCPTSSVVITWRSGSLVEDVAAIYDLAVRHMWAVFKTQNVVPMKNILVKDGIRLMYDYNTPQYIKENSTHLLMNQQGCLAATAKPCVYLWIFGLANCSSNLKQKLCSNPQKDRKVNSF